MLTDQEVLNLLTEIESVENQNRKKYAYDSFQIYEGNLRYFVTEKMKKMFPMTWEMFQISDYSILKKIVDKKSKAYKEAPRRFLETDAETSLYQEVVNKFGLNKAMKKFDVYYNREKYSLMAVFFERKEFGGELKEQFNFIPLAPYEFDVVMDEMGNLETVILSYPDEQVVSGKVTDRIDTTIAGYVQDANIETKTYAVWTKDQHQIWEGYKKKDGKRTFSKLIVDGNESGINPYGVLPFVYVPEEYSQDYPVESPLPVQTIELNAEMSTYYTSGTLQIGTLVLKFPSSQAIETVTNGLFTGMKLPQSENPDSPETSAEYISPSPNMNGHKEAIITHMQAILDEQGINSNQIISPNEKFTSGFDRLLASADVQDIIQDNQQNVYLGVEQKIYLIVKAIYKNFIKRDIFKSKSLSVVYSRPKILVSDTEKLNNIEKMNELGLLTPWEKFMLIDPNISEQQAKEKWDKLQEAKLSQLSALSSGDKKDSFNGAQVTAILDVVSKKALGEIPRSSAVSLLISSFGIDAESAEKIIPPDSFVPNVFDKSGNIAPLDEKIQENEDEESPEDVKEDVLEDEEKNGSTL